MKILIVNSYDMHGGAARATYRLHKALLSLDIDSHMIVQKIYSSEESISVCENEWGDKSSFYNNMPLLHYPQKTRTLFSVAGISNKKIVEFINSSDADIVHLHWIANGFLSIEDIAKIKKPVVWSLHDMWAFTGGCHYNEECHGYLQSCGNCKVLGSYQEADLSKKIFLCKQKIFFEKKDITVVGLSRWLNECSKNSSLLKDKKHINLPNPIDTNLFKQSDKEKARELWNLPKDKKLILFGAMGATSDPRKGFKELSEALHKLTCKDIEFVVFGSNEPEESQKFGFKTYYLGNLDNDEKLVMLYSAVDVMIVPSLQENLSNAIMESLACSTPVIAFDIGGNSDMIEHKQNGYLAKIFDTDDLANGIEWVLHVKNYDEICQNAREKVVREFDSDVVGKKYIELYQSIIDEENQNSFLLYRPCNRMKFITKEIEDWFLELASKNLKYVVYGYGNFGEAALDYFEANIIAFVDQNSNLISTKIVKGEVYSPINLPNMQYDKIIISVLGREEAIERYLVEELGVAKEKIVKFTL